MLGQLIDWRCVKIDTNGIGYTAAEEPLADPAISAGWGYGESKWVAEYILEEATKTTTLKPVIVRTGQLTGGANGAWNIKEWFPSLVKSSQDLKCLPDVPGVRLLFNVIFLVSLLMDPF